MFKRTDAYFATFPVTPNIDAAFAQRQIDVFGEAGREWIARLPALIDAWSERWDLRVEAPYALSYNYVAPATRADGTRVVLKAGVPRDDIAHEFAALRHWDGDGAVRVYESDLDAGVALLEHVEPGDPIISLDDGAATQIAAHLMRRLAAHPSPASHAFPTIEYWGRAFEELRARHDGTSGPLPADIFARGEALYAELAATQAAPVLLHGDLHHWNILSATRESWLVIDPHGVVGEPAFEAGAWMRNPVRHPRIHASATEVRALLDRRLRTFAETLGIDRRRLRDWSIAIACLSAAWSDESNHTDHAMEAISIAEHLTHIE